MILVNFKLYKESFGEGAVRLAKICKKVMEETKVRIYPVVSSLDAYRIKKEIEIEVLIQHVDEYSEGAKTGYSSALQAKELGVSGSLINHSEHKIKPGTIKKILAQWPEKFVSVVCVQTLGQTEKWAKNLKCDYVAYEPKEFIGNKEKSVSSERPEIIKKIVEHYSSIPVLVGAGIHSKEDVKTVLDLGAKGILVATDVVKAEDPKKELRELAEVFEQNPP